MWNQTSALSKNEENCNCPNNEYMHMTAKAIKSNATNYSFKKVAICFI